jgi:hypothetical protein
MATQLAKLDPQVTAAIFGAVVGLVTALATLLVGLKNINTQRDSIRIERERLDSEKDDVRRRQRELDQARVEIAKEKALIVEEMRISTYAKLNTLVYRLRNYIRARLETLKRPGSKLDVPIEIRSAREVWQTLENDLEDVLYEDRAITSRELFRLLHKYSKITRHLLELFDLVAEGRSKEEHLRITGAFPLCRIAPWRARETECAPTLEHIEEMYRWVDEMYIEITNTIHEYLDPSLEDEDKRASKKHLARTMQDLPPPPAQ